MTKAGIGTRGKQKEQVPNASRTRLHSDPTNSGTQAGGDACGHCEMRVASGARETASGHGARTVRDKSIWAHRTKKPLTCDPRRGSEPPSSLSSLWSSLLSHVVPHCVHLQDGGPGLEGVQLTQKRGDDRRVCIALAPEGKLLLFPWGKIRGIPGTWYPR